jgi:carboxyl-terminal processing protease
MPTVQHEVLPGDIGFIEILQFAQPTARQFDQALESLQAQGVKGLVIDVRNNPGGLLETAIVMLSRFVDRDVVVKMEERGSTETARTQGGRVTVRDLPVVILMNEESASASEIFAGVMRHYNKATLVGEHTYGKASVQQLFSLRDGSSAKITIARYLLPDGTDISRVVDEEGEYVSGGVHPDLEVKPNEDVPREFGKPETDPQLQAAVEVLLGVRQVPAAATSASPRSR